MTLFFNFKILTFQVICKLTYSCFAYRIAVF